MEQQIGYYSIGLKDIFIFDERVYFSLIDVEGAVYFKAEFFSRNSLSIREYLAKEVREIEHNTTVKNLKKIKRSEYYDSLKRDLNEYCNREVAERISEMKIKKLEENITKFVKDLVKEMNNE